jgi:hypothetical protein
VAAVEFRNGTVGEGVPPLVLLRVRKLFEMCALQKADFKSAQGPLNQGVAGAFLNRKATANEKGALRAPDVGFYPVIIA